MTRIQKRGAGRKAAKEILELVDLQDPESIDAFLDELKEKLQPKQVEQEQVDAEKKLSELAFYQLTFGKYENCFLRDVPRDYLHWLVKVSEENMIMVGQYLKATDHMEEPDED